MKNKIYLIYKDEKYIAYTDDKILLKDFMKKRKGNFSFTKVSKKEIPKDIQDMMDENLTQLIYYTGYMSCNEYPIIEYEHSKLDDLAIDFCAEFQTLIMILKSHLKCINLTKEEMKIIDLVITRFESVTGEFLDLVGEPEIVLDEFINIGEFIKLLDKGKKGGIKHEP